MRSHTTPEVIWNFINQGVYDIYLIMGLVIGAMLGIVYFVLGCLAASNSNTDAVFEFCGSAVQNVLICDITFSVVGIGAVIWMTAWNKQNVADSFRVYHDGEIQYVPSYVLLVPLLFFFLLIFCFVLGIVSLVYSIIALTSSDCVKAMSSTDGGVVSASGNMGSPLLAIMGVVSGGSFLVLAVIVVGLLVCMANNWFE